MRPSVDRDLLVLQRERQLELVEVDPLPAQQVADAGQRGDRQQAREQRRLEQREPLDLEPAARLEGRHLARDRRLEHERAARDLRGLVQGLQQIAGVVAGEPQTRHVVALGREPPLDLPALRQRRVQRRALPARGIAHGVDCRARSAHARRTRS